MENITHSDFFNLLCEDNIDNLKDFLYKKGKDPKPICPVEFINIDDYKKENE